MPGLDTHTAFNSNYPTNALSIAVTTDTTNELICVGVVTDQQVSSITDDAGLSWHLRQAVTGLNGYRTEFWYAAAPNKLTANNVNVFLSGSGKIDIVQCAFTGLADITQPFDPNPALPVTAVYPGAQGASPPVSTNQARTAIILVCGVAGRDTSPSVSAPFTIAVHDASVYVTGIIAYQLRTSQANNVQAVVTTAGFEDLGIIGDAIMGPGWLRYDTFVGGI